MADKPFTDLDEFLKTDVLKDWMHQNFRNMTSSSSTDFSLPPPPSSATPSSDNNLQQKPQPVEQRRNYRHQQFESSLSSLENFLFLPQLPVDGDDDNENAWLFPHHHYPRQLNQQQKVSPQQQQRSLSSSLLAIVNSTTKSSSGIRTYKNSNNPASFTGHQNDGHETSCNTQFYTDAASTIPTIARRCDDDFEQRRCSRSSGSGSHVCGSSKPTDSLFPFIAANDTVIAAASSNNSNNDDDDEAAAADVVVNNKLQQQKLSSSMSILIKNTSPGNNNSHHNHSTSPPFYLAANHYHRQGKHSHPHHHQPHSHYRHFIRRRLLIFRICQAFSVLLCVLFLCNLVKNSIWTTNDPYKNGVELVSASLTSSASSTSSSRLQNRLIQSWNMPSLVAPSSLLSSSSSTTFKIPEILSVSSANKHNDDREEDDNDSNMYNLMLLDVPNFRFLMNNKTKCNIPRDDDNYFDGVGSGGSDDGTTARNHGKGAGNSASMIFFMIIVHSAPQNFEERQAIRETWGSLQRLGQFHIRLVFLLGLGHELNADDDDFDHDHESNKSYNNISNNNVVADEKGDKMNSGSSKHSRYSFHKKIQRESQQHGDIVAGNFQDSYKNLTYKHLMGYLWLINHCSNVNVGYVLKVDDDAYIDVFQLFEFILRTFGKDPQPGTLICNVFPEGTKPVREKNSRGSKWAVTYEEYPLETYPKYCGGLAYLATPDVINRILDKSRGVKNKPLWIDDVYVTGILRELAHVQPFYLNLRYSYDPGEYRKWLATNVKKSYDEEKVSDKDSVRISVDSADNEINGDKGVTTEEKPAFFNQMNNEDRLSPPKKIPFMIVHMERGSQLGREMRELWNKTVSVWSESGLIN